MQMGEKKPQEFPVAIDVEVEAWYEMQSEMDLSM